MFSLCIFLSEVHSYRKPYKPPIEGVSKVFSWNKAAGTWSWYIPLVLKLRRRGLSKVHSYRKPYKPPIEGVWKVLSWNKAAGTWSWYIPLVPKLRRCGLSVTATENHTNLLLNAFRRLFPRIKWPELEADTFL